jgi:hypothetical protein
MQRPQPDRLTPTPVSTNKQGMFSPGLTVRLRPLSTRCVGRPGYAKATPWSSRLPCSVPLSGMKSPGGLSRGRRLINSMTFIGSTRPVHMQYMSSIWATEGRQHKCDNKAAEPLDSMAQTCRDLNITALCCTALHQTTVPCPVHAPCLRLPLRL